MSGVTLTIQPAEVFLNFTAPAVSLNIEANTVNLSINPAIVTLDLGAQTVNLEINSPNVGLSIGSPAVSLHISCYGGIGPGGIGHVIQDNGTDMPQRANLNFVGATVTDDAGNDATVVTIPSGGHVIQDNGTPLAQQPNLNFVGATVTNDAGNSATVVTITGGGADPSFSITAGEDLAARDLIYFQSDALAYKADNSAEASEAVAVVKTAIATGGTGLAYPPGTVVTGFTGLTPGSRYFLDTAGGFDSIMPQLGASLVVIQQVCTSLSATSVLFDPKTIVVCPAVPNFRTTEGGDFRTTETGDSRITE